MDAWYEKSFGKDYLIVYKHRDLQGAYEEVRRMISWLGLPQGAEVLDLCCGMGRHALALSDFGYRVTGVDLSDVLLAEARQRDTERRVRWIKGDMRDVPLDQRFAAVVNLFTSFGYFTDDEENVKVLTEIRRLLRPGGKFIVDYLNPVHVAAHLIPYSERREGMLHIEEFRKIEQGFVQKRIVIKEDGAAERHYLERVKLYDLPQLLEMAAAAGLQTDEVYGSYHGDPYDAQGSPRLIIVGRQKG
jgi:ubiquinone/menaquinone biosynthesis C-methylase UbiE